MLFTSAEAFYVFSSEADKTGHLKCSLVHRHKIQLKQLACWLFRASQRKDAVWLYVSIACKVFSVEQVLAVLHSWFSSLVLK